MSEHPSDARLLAFGLGTADESESSEIVAHLETCPRCCGRLDGFDQEDDFVFGLRRVTAGGAATDEMTAERKGAHAGLLGGDHLRSLGAYRLERVLGRGGMGVVYLARDSRLGRPVALKTMRPEVASIGRAAERFLREARSAARIEHDHVVPIWQVGEEAGVPFIAMPLLRGETLSDRLARDGRAPLELTLQVGVEVAEGLAAAHELGVIHRDIKPQNIWLEADPASPAPGVRCRRCKILDFGLARAADEDDAALTSPEIAVGSPAYMSPEQARGKPLDGRTDLFSLGVILYRMTTGLPPFSGETAAAVLTSLALDRPSPPPPGPACPPALSDLIVRLLSKDPADRPASAREVAAALRRIEAAALPEAPKPPRRTALAVALAALAGLSVAAMAGVILTIRRPDGRETRTEVPDGSSVTVDAKGDVRVAPPAVASLRDDRAAIEWAIARGGLFRYEHGGVVTSAGPGAAIPEGPVYLIDLNLNSRPGVTDDGLALLRGATRLEELRLIGAEITPAGLDHLADLRHLQLLDIHGTRIGDEALSPVAGLRSLRELSLGNNPITGSGLRHLSGLRTLSTLYLNLTPTLRGGGLSHLRQLDSLTFLDLARDRGVGDDGLAALSGLSNLTHLNLHGTGLTDAGTAHLAGLSKLEYLNFSDTRLGDAGLAHLGGLPRLRALHLFETQVTGEGLRHLEGLPDLAELYLAASKLRDDGLESLGRLRAVWHLDLSQNEVGDVGLAHLKGMTGLSQLDLHRTRVTDAGLVYLRSMEGLVRLDLSATAVTPSGLAALSGHPRLREVRIAGLHVSSAQAEELRRGLPGCTFVGIE